MDKFYSSLQQLPSTLLTRNEFNLLDYDKIQELKITRWKRRNEFLEMSQNSFAAGNGIGLRHLQNFLDLQDAVIVKLLLQKLSTVTGKSDQFHISGLIQAILSESPNLIEFFFINSTEVPIEIMSILIPNCPILFHLIGFYRTFSSFPDYPTNYLYYWNIIILLASTYPTQMTLDLCREVLEEVKNRNYHTESATIVTGLRSLLTEATAICEVFPFLKEQEERVQADQKKQVEKNNKKKKMKT